MKINIYNLAGQSTGEATLSKKVFGVKDNPTLIAQAVRVFMGNQRSSTAKAKNRNEVHGTTKKVWAQKGTGHARHGSRKAPIFVGGGVTHGPTGEQTFKLALSKKMRQAALKTILSRFAAEGRLLAIEKFSTISPKTRDASKLVNLLEKAEKNLADSQRVGIVTTKSLPNITRAFANISGMNLLSLQSLNVYNLSLQGYLIFSKKALAKLSK